MLAAALATIASPTPAFAASAGVAKQALVFGAEPGESNHVTITATRVAQSGGGRPKSGFSVSDANAPVAAGAGCSRKSVHTVVCPASGITKIIARSGDRDDVVVNETAIRSVLDGENGRDTILGGSGNDRIWGGDEQDFLSGRGGRDTIKTSGHWADVITCGSGRDTVFADWQDKVASTCEAVVRPAR